MLLFVTFIFQVIITSSQQSGPYQADTVETEIRTLDGRTYFDLINQRDQALHNLRKSKIADDFKHFSKLRNKVQYSIRNGLALYRKDTKKTG